MFLFTTPNTGASASVPATPVMDAIRRGAEQTGTPFAYLLKTAQRESSLDPAAKAPTSSATGLFLYIEQTWLGLVKSDGASVGLGDLAGSITARSDGSLAVDDAGARQRILKLREDPTVSSVMAGVLTQQNRSALASSTGREPSSGELYMAHLLGQRGATNLIRLAGASPSRPLAAEMPDAAAANRSIFYDRRGNARGAGEIYAMLAANGSASAEAVADTSRSAPITVTGQASASGFRGLFQTATRTGPVSDAVAKIWRVNNTASAGTRTAALSFFPRSDMSATDASATATDETEVATTEATAAVPSVPLPPPRPVFETSAVELHSGRIGRRS